ncbi:MAG: sodium:solute symporter family protein [bacterium]|jgi:SSS family solute:Na+ symporter|nr:sodium:solute symporter family protein [bacterium]
MHLNFDSLIIGLYLLIVLCVGLLCGKNLKTLKDYSVSTQSFSSWIIFATLSASFIGGGFSIGNAEKVFRFGIANIVALWGFSIKEIFVARYIAPRTVHFPNFISVGDLMEPAYGKTGRIITGLFSVFLCAGIVGAQVGAMGKIFNVFLGLDPLWGILIGCGIVISYSTVGGMRAVIFTDVIQFILLGVGIPVALFFGIEKAGGFEAVRQAIPSTHFSIPGDALTWLGLISLFLTFVLGETLVPPYVQRLFIGKNSRETAKGNLISGLFSFPFFAITGSIGLVALALKPDLDPNLAMPYVIQSALPIGIRGLVIAGVISIVMSSSDSFLNGASTCFVNDIINPLRKKALSHMTQMRLAQAINLIVGVMAIVFAIKIESVLDILIYAYNFWAPIILVPLVAVLLGWKASRLAFLCGTIAGASSAILWNLFLHNPAGFDGLVIGFGCNLIAFSLANRFQKQV